MRATCYEFINSRISKKIIFIEDVKNDVIEIKYKILMHWKNDIDDQSYTDNIKLSSSKFIEILKSSAALCESYNISQKLSTGDKQKVIHFFEYKQKYNEEMMDEHTMTKGEQEEDDEKIKKFISNYEYWYVIRREGQPSLEEIDEIEEFEKDAVRFCRWITYK